MAGFRSARLLMVMMLVFLAFLVMENEAGRGRTVGGRTEVKDVRSNQEVQELGRFAVEEYKKTLWSSGLVVGLVAREASKLKFAEVVAAERQVVAAERQVVAGMMYYLKVVVVMQNGERRQFDSVVVVKPWARSKQLVGFAPFTNVLPVKESAVLST